MLRITRNYDLALVSVTPRLQIARNCDSYFRSPVLDWTIRSGPNFLNTRLDYGLGVPDHMVRSFLQSPFPSDKKTELYSPVSLKPDRTAVWGCRTVRSGLFQRSTKKATVQTGPDRGQSTYEAIPTLKDRKSVV